MTRPLKSLFKYIKFPKSFKEWFWDEFWSGWTYGFATGFIVGQSLIVILFATIHFLIWGGFVMK